ncbi:hypothetical protein SLEP1_g3694 [Rubroshorea leprosula]|uniref:Reverse transcriptase/retrotransposon-derived protein RNase H-like domain-containing protein n=1 Tax=Rubroshorea leprosula TaxID=152421 RepID=A0AAV5HSB6_9ROSI|nr:hypothetical protein SLEP1_g3694 [Rubroshorea leprosula]
MVNTRSIRAGNQAQPLGQEGGDENQPHNLAHNSTSIPNQGDVVTTQLAAMQQQFGGQSHVAPVQQPLLDDVTRRLDSLEKLVAEQRGAPPPHHNTNYIPHPLNTNITLEPYPIGFKIPQLETYDGTKDPDDHLHAFYSCMQAQNASDALMCKIFPSTLRGNARTWSQIFMQIKNKMDLRQLGLMRSSAATRDHTRYCDFHQDYGHTTEQCNSLRYDGPIYGFNNQPVQVEGVLTLNVAFGSGRTYVTPSVCRHARNSNLGISAQAQHQSIKETNSLEAMSLWGGEASGYHQVPMALEDEEKTSFYAGDEIYCYVMMPFGLKNVADLDETFNNLRKNRMRLNPAKCIFGVESGKFLGFMVSRRGIKVNPKKIKAIVKMELLKLVKDIQRLTEKVAALHRFISKPVDKCLPFFKIMRSAAQKDEFGKQKKFEWNLECQAAFDELKSYLSSFPLLTKAIDGEILYLYLDIFDEAISSVLVREEGKQQKPIYYTSSVLHGVELRYPITKKATLAVVTSARKSRPYFQSHPIIVFTDQPFRQILQKLEC